MMNQRMKKLLKGCWLLRKMEGKTSRWSSMVPTGQAWVEERDDVRVEIRKRQWMDATAKVYF